MKAYFYNFTISVLALCISIASIGIQTAEARFSYESLNEMVEYKYKCNSPIGEGYLICFRIVPGQSEGSTQIFVIFGNFPPSDGLFEMKCRAWSSTGSRCSIEPQENMRRRVRIYINASPFRDGCPADMRDGGIVTVPDLVDMPDGTHLSEDDRVCIKS
jgi:hypothetical protein